MKVDTVNSEMVFRKNQMKLPRFRSFRDKTAVAKILNFHRC